MQFSDRVRIENNLYRWYNASTISNSTDRNGEFSICIRLCVLDMTEINGCSKLLGVDWSNAVVQHLNDLIHDLEDDLRNMKKL